MLPPPYVKQEFWDLIKKCSLTEKEERQLKEYTEDQGLMFLSTPFSREAVDRLEKLGVLAYKVGSGECNNLPLLQYIASKNKPMIISTGMNEMLSVIYMLNTLYLNKHNLAFLHCTSMYPTPYGKVRLGAMREIHNCYSNIVYGYSDHTPTNYASFAAVAQGASIIEKHFISDKTWDSPDVSVSINPAELKDLIDGVNAIWQMKGGGKHFLEEEKPVSEFAFASLVTTQDVKAGETLTPYNIWVKRPGTGIPASEYERVLGEIATRDIKKNQQLRWEDFN
jgi:N-acetylneuraminate synthase